MDEIEKAVAAIRAQGGSDDDVKAYLKSKGFVEQPATAPTSATAATPPSQTASEAAPKGYGGRVYEPSAARSILSGVTGGMSSKLAGTVDAVIDKITKGADFTDAYVSNVRGMQGAERQYREAHPKSDISLRMAGGILPAVALGLAGGGPAATGALLTAGQVAGGTDPVEDLTGTTGYKAVAGMAGGAVGGKVLDAGTKALINSPVGEFASRGAQWLAGKTSGARSSLLGAVARQTGNRGRVRDVIAQSIKNSGVTPDDLLKTVQARGASILPQTLPDIAGGDVRGMAGVIANSPGGPRRVFEDALYPREAQSASLVKSVLGQAESPLGGIGAARAVRDAVRAAQKASANTLYEKAYASGAGPILDQRLQQLVDERPLMRKVLARAAEMAKNEGNPLPSIKVIPPKPPAAALIPDEKWAQMAEASGAMTEQPVLDVRGLDYVQRALRESIHKGINGTSVSKQEASAINKGIGKVLDGVAGQFKDLKAARADFAANARKLEALDTGLDLYRYSMNPGSGAVRSKLSTHELDKLMASFGPEERDLFQLAARDAAAGRAESGSRSLLGQVRPLIGTERSAARTAVAAGPKAEKVLADLADIRNMGQTTNAILGGSPTAPREAFKEAFNPPSQMLLRDALGRRGAFFAADILGRAAKGGQRMLTQPALMDAAELLTAGARPGTSAITTLEQLVNDLNRRELMRRGISGGLLAGVAPR